MALIENFSHKLDHLLHLHDKNQKWLTRCLKLSYTTISNWRANSSVPDHHLRSLCVRLEIKEETLLEKDFALFKKAVDDLFPLGSGKLWEKLIQKENTEVTGLSLEVVDLTPVSMPLRGVGYQFNPKDKQPLLQVAIGQHIRFSIPSKEIKKSGFIPAGIMVFINDRNGWSLLSPRINQSDFACDGDAWRLPVKNKNPLFITDPVGIHTAIALSLAVPIPIEILNEIHSTNIPDSKTVEKSKFAKWIADSVARWILNEKTKHHIYKLEFNVMAK